MKTTQATRTALICLAVLVTIATIMIAGCTDSTEGRQNTVSTGSETPTSVMAVTATTTAQPTPAPDPTKPFITIDPIGDKKIGDLLIVSGTTSLPEKSAIYMYRTYGDSGEEKMTANRQILAGTGGTNRWRFVSDTSGFEPGSYKIRVAAAKKGVEGSAQFSLKGTYLGTDTPVFYSGAATGSAGAPTITVRPMGDKTQGDVFLISGTTTLPAGTILMYKVYPDYFEDKSKRSASSSPVPSSIAGDTIVIKGSGNTNTWSCALDTEGYEKTNYIVNVTTISEDNLRTDVFGSAHFVIR
jgi:PBP1b-binding outer membrane lipoprotein LpoB